MRRILATVFLTVISLSAFAEIESGAYIIGSIGYGYVSNGTGYNVTNNTSYTLGVEGGYAFNKYLAVDGSITFMPNTYQNISSNYYLTDVAVRGSVPLGTFASGYIHVGPGVLTNSSVGTNSFGAFLGLGALFQLSHHWGINIEDYGILIPGNTNSDINVIALGAAYAF